MATASKTAPLTIEEWEKQFSDVRAELLDGQVVYKAMPSSEHADCQSSLAALLKSEFQWKKGGSQGWWIRTEISVAYKGRQSGFIHDSAGWRQSSYPQKPTGKIVRERPDWGV